MLTLISNARSTLLTEIFKKEGIPGLFRGNFANCLRISPCTAFEFFFFDKFRGLFQSLDSKLHQHQM